MSAELELQKLVLDTIQGDANLAPLIDGRVYDCVRSDSPFPYVSFGTHQVVEDDAECIVGGHHSFQLDVWSRQIGFVECKRIGAALRKALHETDASIDENALVYIRIRSTTYMRDPDGLTSHGILDINARIEEANA